MPFIAVLIRQSRRFVKKKKKVFTTKNKIEARVKNFREGYLATYTR